MKIALLSFGSRGDIVPLIVLAKELKRRGHAPCIVANSDLASVAAKHHVLYREVNINIRDFLHTEGRDIMHAGSASKSLKILFSILQKELSGIGAQLKTLLEDADMLIANERYFLLADSFAAYYKIPLMQLCFQPKGITKEYPYPYYSSWYFKWLSNRSTHLLVEKKLIKNMLPPVNNIRNTFLDLPLLSAREGISKKLKTPVIQCFSKHIFAPPADWGTQLLTVGNLYLKKEHKEGSAALAEFLNRDTPVAYIGFGSMLYDTNRLKNILIRVSSRLNINFVWSLNWSETPEISPGLLTEAVFIIKESDHGMLFPRVDFVIHHGGSGTVAAAFRNVKPQLVAWFMLDQEFWAKCIENKEGGINLGNFHRVSAESLETGLLRITESAAFDKEKGLDISKKMTLEDAAGSACNFIESYYRE